MYQPYPKLETSKPPPVLRAIKTVLIVDESAVQRRIVADFFSAEAFGQNIAVKRLETGQICPRQPHDILQSINQIMLKDLTTDHYLTMISGLLDLTSGRLCFAQAGHPYPILQAKEGTFHHIGRDSLPIGISQTARFQDHHLHLALGERLILY